MTAPRHRAPLPGLMTPAQYAAAYQEAATAADVMVAARAEAVTTAHDLRLAAEVHRLRAVARHRDTTEDIARHIAGVHRRTGA